VFDYDEMMTRAAEVRARNEAELADDRTADEAVVPSNPDVAQGADRPSASAHDVAADAAAEPGSDAAAESATPVPTMEQDVGKGHPAIGGPSTEDTRADGQPPVAVPKPRFSAEALAVLDRPLLLSGEDEKLYDELVAAVRATVKPGDFLEEIWIRDFIANQWELMRHRRFITALIAATEHEALEKILSRLLSSGSFDIASASEAEALAWRYIRGEEDANTEVDDVLKNAGLAWDSVSALAASLKIDEIERFDRLIRIAEKRRDDTLRQIDSHKRTLGSALRGAVEQIEDAEFRVLDEPVEEFKKAA
jgi:hypothetical protein